MAHDCWCQRDWISLSGPRSVTLYARLRPSVLERQGNSQDWFLTMLAEKGVNHVSGIHLCVTGGEGGIRTHEGLLTLAGFQDQCIQPLCHLSKIFSIPRVGLIQIGLGTCPADPVTKDQSAITASDLFRPEGGLGFQDQCIDSRRYRRSPCGRVRCASASKSHAICQPLCHLSQFSAALFGAVDFASRSTANQPSGRS